MKTQKRRREVSNYFESTGMYKIMKSTLSYMTMNNQIDFRLNIGGGSYTDGKVLVVGLMDDLIFESFSSIYNIILALLSHESQHVVSTSFDRFKSYNEEVSKYLVANIGVGRSFAKRTTHFMGNALEDGRIERILVNKFPGIALNLKFLNMYIWEINEIKEDTCEVSSLFSSILTLSKLGVLPKSFNKHYSGTRIEMLVKSIEEDIELATKSNTSGACFNIAEEIIKKLCPFFIDKLREEETRDNLQDFWEEKMEELLPEESYEGFKEEELNNNQRKTIRLGEDNKDKPKEIEENEGGYEETNSMDDGDSKSDSTTEDASSEPSQKEDSNEDSKELSNSDKELEENLRDELDKIMKDLDDKAREAFTKAKKEDKEQERKEESQKNECLSKDDIDEVRNNLKTLDKFREKGIDFNLNSPIFPEVKAVANKFKKDIESIFNNKQGLNLFNQDEGIINPSDLHRVEMGNYDIFMQEGSKVTSEYVAYILRDGSGSMAGLKHNESMKALAIIEEGIKGVIPFKLTSFNASGSTINHSVIKGFNNTSNKSYSTNYYKQNDISGYNNDGFSIGIATKELMKRQEKDKILIILSDGMPIDVDGTKEAIKEARKLGIIVIGIAFGDKMSRELMFPRYKYMYEKNIISTSPEGIPNALTRLFKKILIRG